MNSEALDELVDRWWSFADRHPIIAGVILFGFFLAGVIIERRRQRRDLPAYDAHVDELVLGRA